MSKPVIALDADGVLIDYGLAYAGAWHRAFGQRPALRDPTAYWPIDRWEVERLADDERLTKLRLAFDDEFWGAIPPIAGAIGACTALVGAGFDLVCVTALPEAYRAARQRNLQAHGFPIEVGHATDNVLTTASPKADTLNALAPVAFVDDFLPYFVGVNPSIHRALILREPTGSPNTGDLLVHVDSQHADLASFARWWLERGSAGRK
ncbi:HAD family hydrolase [Caenimonas sedimenti]|uniref:HAD family hydrolase n=1 Tax=Caenimonas sedimenti TaxID=2596921 RepID=A0A562ZHL7_9BURK|nr:HAD family hydrolase [Caenimonas sedimenti]TWO68089.1 HAD family hydrolase [Caenimonas sedimenti]